MHATPADLADLILAAIGTARREGIATTRYIHGAPRSQDVAAHADHYDAVTAMWKVFHALHPEAVEDV